MYGFTALPDQITQRPPAKSDLARPGGWWYLIPLGVLLLGCLVGTAVLLAPGTPDRAAEPIAEGDTITFELEKGQRYWVFHGSTTPHRGHSCEYSGDAANGLRISGGSWLASKPPDEVHYGGRRYHYLDTLSSDDDSSLTARCLYGPLLVEPAAPPRWQALLPLALAVVAAIGLAIVIAVRRRLSAGGSVSPGGGGSVPPGGGTATWAGDTG